jgi:hypothetical protein
MNIANRNDNRPSGPWGFLFDPCQDEIVSNSMFSKVFEAARSCRIDVRT